MSDGSVFTPGESASTFGKGASANRIEFRKEAGEEGIEDGSITQTFAPIKSTLKSGDEDGVDKDAVDREAE